MTTIIAFGAGMVFGGCIGFIVVAVLTASKDGGK